MIVVPAMFGIPAAVIALKMWLSHTEKMAKIRAGSTSPGEMDERLARLEQAVEAVAVEMERVGEGQRFVTKLLAERASPTNAAQVQERASTPE